jgi:endonuclease G
MKHALMIALIVFIGLGGLSITGQEAETWEESSAPMEIHCKHFFLGYPLGTPATNDLIIRDIYALSNNDDTKFADWVAYRLTWREVDGIASIDRKWMKDPYLDDDETLEPQDYKGASKAIDIDRGHQAPLASFKGSPWASGTNYLSNITPQKKNLNQGTWKNLEERIRDIVFTGKIVYVMTGPLYEKELEGLPNCSKPHKLPSGYWKIVIVTERDSNEFQYAAFLFEQDAPKKGKIIDYLTTVDEIEERSKLNFFWEMDANLEKEIEREDNRDWAETVFTG